MSYTVLANVQAELVHATLSQMSHSLDVDAFVEGLATFLLEDIHSTYIANVSLAEKLASYIKERKS